MNDTKADDIERIARETIDAAAKTHLRYLEDLIGEVDGFGLEHVEAIEEHRGLDAKDAYSFWESADAETVSEAYRDYYRVENRDETVQ